MKSDTPKEVGLRYNEGKTPLYKGVIMYFPRALEAVARISEFGAKKYSWGNWHHIKDGYENCSESMTRHLFKEAKGEVKDSESELDHAAHLACNALGRLEFLLKERENNDRA